MLQHDPWELIASMQSVVISSVSADGAPHASYAPFVESDHRFYVSLSMLSTHTDNLLHHPGIALLFIEDESKSANIFARKRVSFDAVATPVERDSILFNGTMTLFEDRFGEMASIYKNMPDFQLFELMPLRGRAVFGFGQAYDFAEGRFGSVAVGGR